MKRFICALFASIVSFVSFGTIPPITGITQVCLGAHKILSDATLGGTWSSSDASIATIDSTGRVHGISVGTTTITYTIDTSYVTTVVTVNAIPSVYSVTGGGVCCAGGPGVNIGITGSSTDVLYTLIHSGLGGTAYLGTGGPMVLGSPNAAGFYYVYASGYYTHCATNMAGSAIVTVDPHLPIITGPLTVCESAAVKLQDSTPGGTWSSHFSALVNVDDSTGVITGLQGGQAVITYTLPSGCSRMKTITVLPMPLPVISYNDTANTFYLSQDYDQYQWYDSIQGEISGATAPTLAAFNTDYYSVKVARNYGCQRASALFYFNGDKLSVNYPTENNKIALYPNPVTTQMTVASSNKINHLAISNLLGQVVYAHDYCNERVQCDMTGLPLGLYFLQINGLRVIQFVKH